MNNLLNIIPDPDVIPVPAGWFQILLHLTFYLHLISVGMVLGLSVISVLGYFKGKANPQWKALANTLSRLLPFVIAFAVNAAFVTPFTDGDNLLVREPGQYTMRDYVINGLPIFVIQTIAIVALLAAFYFW